MDVSNEADLDIFRIGPSTILGRTIAFKVLFCKSMWQLRYQIFHVLLNFFFRSRDFLSDALSWLHPRNPQGILVLVTLIAFLLKRYANFKIKAKMAYKRKIWKNMMRRALTYEEWAQAAKMLDRDTPKINESDLYDEELVRNKLQELCHRRQEGSLRDIIFCMRADLVRNLGNMCNPELHKGRLHIPKLIKEYIDEVSNQLKTVCEWDSDDLSLEEKLAFMHETRHAFGRTALLLSGGASLGSFHVGVVKTLVEHKLLPRIVAGSSVGSIMCSIVATRSWTELQIFFKDSWKSLQFFDQLGGIFSVVKRVTTYGAVHEIRQLQWMLRNLTDNLTFQEAYDMTGRVLGITVCSPRKHEPPRCLNYLTSPHVFIWSAVTASCAFPGLFEAQELMAKDRSGRIVPYHPPFKLDPDQGSAPVRRWRDGSLEIDLPMIQLKELFNVNHFIVSQANPHIAPLLRLKDFVRACGGNFAAKFAHIAEMEVKHRCNQILGLGFPLGGVVKLFAQDWEGDVTVVMPATLSQYLKIIQNPSSGELQKAANQGRRCTWEKLSAIKANCGIELALDECVTILNHMRKLKRSSERADIVAHRLSQAHSHTSKFNGNKRIPSWYSIARHNSTGSLEEDYFSDIAVGQQGVGNSTGGLLPGRNLQAHDGSDSESERIDLHSWTRSGGPLMRTTSANLFIDFVQNLDVETDLNEKPHPDDISWTIGRDIHNASSRATTSDKGLESVESDQEDIGSRISMDGFSIKVGAGDLLQPKRMQNGIIFNVVKKEETPSNKNHDLENSNSYVAECMQLDCPEGDTDASSGYRSEDDEVLARNRQDEAICDPKCIDPAD